MKYEIEESYKRGNGLLGIYIHGIKDEKQQNSWWRGRNPFGDIEVKITSSFFGLWDYISDVALSDMIPTYYWYDDEGRDNLAAWIEKAAIKAGK